MSNVPMIVDPLSEMLALSTYGNTKNLIITLLQMRGPFDTGAYRAALGRVSDTFRELRSCLKEVKSKGRYRLVREHRPDLELPMKIYELPKLDLSAPGIDAFLESFREDLDRSWDIFSEPPAALHLLKQGSDRHIAGLVMHHSAGDAAVASEVGREIIYEYCRSLYGDRPPEAESMPSVSTATKRRARKRKQTLSDFTYRTKLSLIPLKPSHVLPVGSGRADDQRQHHVKRVLTEEETTHVVRGSLKKRLSLIDLLVVCANSAVDIWNTERNIQPGTLTASMTINMRGRFQGLDTPNTSGLLYFETRPEERKNPAEFARLITLSRIKQFRRHMDLHFYENVKRMNSSLRLLPFRLKRPMVHRLMQRHQLSVAVTLMGVIWPEIKRGKPTGDSFGVSFHDTIMEEVHGLGYKLLSNTHVLLIVYIFRKRLNLVLAASACHFTRQEADAFLDVVRKQLFSSV